MIARNILLISYLLYPLIVRAPEKKSLPDNQNDQAEMVKLDQYVDFSAKEQNFIQQISLIKDDDHQMLSSNIFMQCQVFTATIYHYYGDDSDNALKYMKNFIEKQSIKLCIFEIKAKLYLMPIAFKRFFIEHNMGYENKDALFIINSSIHISEIVINLLVDDFFAKTYVEVIDTIKKNIKESEKTDTIIAFYNSDRAKVNFIISSIPENIYNYTEKKYNKTNIQLLNKISKLIKFILLKGSNKFTGALFKTREKKEKYLIDHILKDMLFNVYLSIYVVKTKDNQYYLIPAQLLNDYPEKFNLDSARVDRSILMYDFLGSAKDFLDFTDQLPEQSANQKLGNQMPDIISPKVRDKFVLYEQYIKQMQHIERNGMTVETCLVLFDVSKQFYYDYHYQYDKYLKKMQNSNADIAILKFENKVRFFIQKKMMRYLQKEFKITDLWLNNASGLLIDQEFIDKVNAFTLELKATSPSPGNSWYNTIKSWGSNFWYSTSSFFNK